VIHSYNKSKRGALFLKFISYSILTSPADSQHNMTNTYCCVYNVETADDGQ